MILTDTDKIQQHSDKFWLNSWISKLSWMSRLLRVQSVVSGLILLPSECPYCRWWDCVLLGFPKKGEAVEAYSWDMWGSNEGTAKLRKWHEATNNDNRNTVVKECQRSQASDLLHIIGPHLLFRHQQWQLPSLMAIMQVQNRYKKVYGHLMSIMSIMSINHTAWSVWIPFKMYFVEATIIVPLLKSLGYPLGPGENTFSCEMKLPYVQTTWRPKVLLIWVQKDLNRKNSWIQ